MLIEDIKNRMQWLGISNIELAELSGTNPSQLSLFFKDEGATLKPATLQKILEILDMDTSIFTYRIELAKKAAMYLKKTYTTSEVTLFSRNEMAEKCALDEINLFIDVDVDGFNAIRNSKIMDIEATFPYFKTVVLQYMEMRKSSTKKNVMDSILSVVNESKLLPILIGLTPITIAFIANLVSRKDVSRNITKATFPIISLSEAILKIKK